MNQDSEFVVHHDDTEWSITESGRLVFTGNKSQVEDFLDHQEALKTSETSSIWNKLKKLFYTIKKSW